MKIVVTGGMGYIGSHVCKALMESDVQVISVDHHYKQDNVVPGVEYITCDYADEEFWHAVTTDTGNINRFGELRGIVHCAGSSTVAGSVSNPSEYYNNNVVKTIQMLDCLKHLQRKPFIIFSSSASVYGSSVQWLAAPHIAEHVMHGPQSPYARSKSMIEQVLNDYEVYGFRSTIFRYFNAAGLDDGLTIEHNDTHIIPRLFAAHKNKTSFKLNGNDYNTHDGTCVRDYIHVNDIAQAHVAVAFDMRNNSESNVYNLGTGNGYSNAEVIYAFGQVVGPVDVLVDVKREGDADRLIADPSKFIDKFTLHPINSDLEVIIQSMKKNYE